MIDVSRLALPIGDLATRPPHSHIITSRQAGWHNTVNIRVLSPSLWYQIAASPTLETVEQLEIAKPDSIIRKHTNIFFFFEVHSATRAP